MQVDGRCVRVRGGRNGWSSIQYAPMRSSWNRAAIVLLLLVAGACSGEKAKELLETAEFEERQMNVSHAKQLYEDVIRLYPTSQEADTARTRLTKLNRG